MGGSAELLASDSSKLGAKGAELEAAGTVSPSGAAAEVGDDPSSFTAAFFTSSLARGAAVDSVAPSVPSSSFIVTSLESCRRCFRLFKLKLKAEAVVGSHGKNFVDSKWLNISFTTVKCESLQGHH